MNNNYVMINLENHIIPLVDCRTLAVTNILRYDDIDFDSEELFALSGGLDLWTLPTSPNSRIHYVFPRNMYAEIEFLQMLSYDLTIKNNVSNSDLIAHLHNGHKLIVDADRFYLPCFVEAFGAQHFGYHCMNIIGHDTSVSGDSLFYALEFLSKEHVHYADDDLHNARFAECAMHSPQGRTYIISGKPGIDVDNSFIYKCLLETTTQKLDSENGLLKNYQKVISTLEKAELCIGQTLLEKYAKNQLRLLEAAIKETDPYCSAYRMAHAKGMKKIAEKCSNNNLWLCADEWEQIAYRWQESIAKKSLSVPLKDKYMFWKSFLLDVKDTEIGLLNKTSSIVRAALSKTNCDAT